MGAVIAFTLLETDNILLGMDGCLTSLTSMSATGSSSISSLVITVTPYGVPIARPVLTYHECVVDLIKQSLLRHSNQAGGTHL